jgi:hypothetical protein
MKLGKLLIRCVNFVLCQFLIFFQGTKLLIKILSFVLDQHLSFILFILKELAVFQKLVCLHLYSRLLPISSRYESCQFGDLIEILLDEFIHAFAHILVCVSTYFSSLHRKQPYLIQELFYSKPTQLIPLIISLYFLKCYHPL